MRNRVSRAARRLVAIACLCGAMSTTIGCEGGIFGAPPVPCTAAGCYPGGLSIEITGTSSASASYDVRLVLDGSECTGSFPRLGYITKCGGFELFRREEDSGFALQIHTGIQPEHAQLELRRDGQVVLTAETDAADLTYDVTYPNGEACGPRCEDAWWALDLTSSDG